MSDEEEYSDEEEEEEDEEEKEEEPPPKTPEPKKITGKELEELIKKEISEWRAQRAKEEEELKRLKEKQAKRKVLRQKEEERLEEERRREEEERQRLVEEKKQREQEEKLRRVQEAMRKKQEAQQKKQAEAGKSFTIQKKGAAHHEPGTLREEMSKTPEQREQEKQMQLEFRIQPLQDMSEMDKEAKKKYALELWDKIVSLVTETYDMQEHQKVMDYDLKELKERHRQKLRQKALKLGLEPEALTGKYPPKIQVACKYERREDTRSYEDKKKLFEGGIDVIEKEHHEKHWKEKMEEFQSRTRVKLPKWFGERPGRKKDDPPTPEDVKPDDDDDLLLGPPLEEEEEAAEEEGGGGDEGGGGGGEGGDEEGGEEEEEE